MFVLCGEYEASCIDCFNKGISTGSDTNASVLAVSLNWTKNIHVIRTRPMNNIVIGFWSPGIYIRQLKNCELGSSPSH